MLNRALFSQPPPTHFFLIVTELLPLDVRSVTNGATHEFGNAGAAKFPGLVKSRCLVVGAVGARERRKYRGLVLAVLLPSRTAERQPRQHVRHRPDAVPLCGLCVRLRIQV